MTSGAWRVRSASRYEAAAAERRELVGAFGPGLRRRWRAASRRSGPKELGVLARCRRTLGRTRDLHGHAQRRSRKLEHLGSPHRVQIADEAVDCRGPRFSCELSRANDGLLSHFYPSPHAARGLRKVGQVPCLGARQELVRSAKKRFPLAGGPALGVAPPLGQGSAQLARALEATAVRTARRASSRLLAGERPSPGLPPMATVGVRHQLLGRSSKSWRMRLGSLRRQKALTRPAVGFRPSHGRHDQRAEARAEAHFSSSADVKGRHPVPPDTGGMSAHDPRRPAARVEGFAELFVDGDGARCRGALEARRRTVFEAGQERGHAQRRRPRPTRSLGSPGQNHARAAKYNTSHAAVGAVRAPPPGA